MHVKRLELQAGAPSTHSLHIERPMKDVGGAIAANM